MGQGAYDWLSRGLVEGIITFIERAKGKGFGLKGAFYEFQWPSVLKALHAAKKRGASVEICSTTSKTKLARTAKTRTPSMFRHQGRVHAAHQRHVDAQQVPGPDREEQADGVAVRLTNLTENGIFGHATGRSRGKRHDRGEVLKSSQAEERSR